MRQRLNRESKFFLVEVNGEEAVVAFTTLDPSADAMSVRDWVYAGERGFFSLRVTDDDVVCVQEMFREQFEALTLGQITGQITDNDRYPKPAVSVA